MEGKMKVAVMNGIGKMGFEERDIPTAESRRSTSKTGICRNLRFAICIIMKQEQSEIMW